MEADRDNRPGITLTEDERQQFRDAGYSDESINEMIRLSGEIPWNDIVAKPLTGEDGSR